MRYNLKVLLTKHSLNESHITELAYHKSGVFVAGMVCMCYPDGRNLFLVSLVLCLGFRCDHRSSQHIEG